jgi:hypothetical protein
MHSIIILFRLQSFVKKILYSLAVYLSTRTNSAFHRDFFPQGRNERAFCNRFCYNSSNIRQEFSRIGRNTFLQSLTGNLND